MEALRDPAHALVKFTEATITPEAAVVADGRVVYRGRIDDRYVDLGVERPSPTQRDLADALTAVLAGKPGRAARRRRRSAVSSPISRDDTRRLSPR